MPISAHAAPESLTDAFRAAFLLTGSLDLAENAVLHGIAALAPNDDVEKDLVKKTVELIFRRRMDFPNQLEHSLALLPPELRRLIWLAPVGRDCFILRVLFGITAASCAKILNLTIEQLDVSLRAALRQLPMVSPSVCWARPIHQVTGARQ